MSARRPPARGRGDEGAVLVLTLLLMMILSAVAVSLVFLSNTETYTSLNYRLMSQARYGAESGVHKAMNYLFNGYAQPGGAGDPLSSYDMTVSPVTYNGAPVVLSSMSGVASNYPAAATAAAFASAAAGTLSVGGYTITYGVSATLVSMQTFTVYGSGATGVVQIWRLTSDGSIGGARPAQVEVSALLEQQKVPLNTWGLFATNANCGALSFSGGESTDSYDSTELDANGKPVISLTDGDVGTNGNLSISGNAVVNGTLNTPRTGVGNCKSGAVDALTESGKATVTEGLVKLPQALTFPTPPAPNPLPPTTTVSLSASASCASIPLSAPATCSGSGGSLTITPNGAVVSLGNVNLSGGENLHLQAGTYNLNSVNLSGNSNLVIDEPPTVPTAQLGAVVLDVAGRNVQNPVSFSGGTIQNPSYKPEYLQILYGGTGGVNISGGVASCAIVFAPNAAINLSGGSNFYGEILGSTFNDSGGTAFHYDRSLKQKGVMPGNYMLSAFTWKKY